MLTIPFFYGDVAALKRRITGRYIRLNIMVATAISISFILSKFGLYFNFSVGEIVNNPVVSGYLPSSFGITDLLTVTLFKAIFLGETSLDPPMWTISIEFIGSVVVMALFLDRGYILICSFLCILVVSIYTFGAAPMHLSRIAEGTFIILCGTAIHYVKLKHNIIVFFAGVFGIYFGSFRYDSPIFPHFQLFIENEKNISNLIGAVFLCYAILNGWGSTFFSWKPFLVLGKLSYSLYLSHFIVLCSITCYFYLLFGTYEYSTFYLFVIYTIFSLIAALFLYIVADKKAIKVAHQFSKYWESKK